MDPKTQWRKTWLAKRQQLTADFVRTASRRIAHRLFGLEALILAERIGLYAAFQKEVETAELFAKANALRKEIYYPKVDRKQNRLRYYRVHALSELQPGFAGILEPARGHPLTNLDYLDGLVVPGIVFDKRGHRLGFGGGYYDRLLAGYHGRKVALAFDFQLVESLPATVWDERVDVIITEERIIQIP